MGTGRFHEIADIISEQFDIKLQRGGTYHGEPEADVPYAYVRIARGCSRNCAFCILPTIRGPLKPFDLTDIKRQLDEDSHIRNDVPLKEVILVSQDTISQGVDELDQIIGFLSEQPGIEWVRLQYLFPDRRILKLLPLFEKYPKLVPYLDIPFQHASPKILRAMNRPDNVELFSEIINEARKIRPDLEVRTSFIVGFAGETEEDFLCLKNFLAENRIDKLAIFRYSHEEGTPAFEQQDELSDEEKINRMNELRDFFLKSREEYRRSLQGKEETVIIEKIDGKNIEARRAHDSPDIDEIVFIDNVPDIESYKTGQMVKVRLQMPLEYDWFADII